jgi:predicted phage-related endonuclease
MALTVEQLRERTQWIGSSDVPAILGVDPHRNVGDVFLEKSGRTEPVVTSSDAADWGDRLEPVLCDWVGERVGEEVVRGEHRQSEDGILRAQLDGWIPSLGEPVECKTSGLLQPMFNAGAAGWGADGTDDVPFRVIAQVQFALLLTGSESGHVAAFLGGGAGPRHYVVTRHAELQEEIEARCRAFWVDHVLAGVPPEVTPSIDTLRVVAREAGKSVEVDHELIQRYVDVRDQAGLVGAALDDAKAALINALGDAEEGYSPFGGVSYRANRNGVRTLRINGGTG